MDEFLVIMQVLDPSLEMKDVEDTFVEIGATDSLDENLFFDWCTSLFGDFDDDQFVEQLRDLISVNQSPAASISRTLVEGAPDIEMDFLEARRREWY